MLNADWWSTLSSSMFNPVVSVNWFILFLPDSFDLCLYYFLNGAKEDKLQEVNDTHQHLTIKLMFR